MSLKKIAITTKGLSVTPFIFSTIKDGDNMVKFKPSFTSAIKALFSFPFSFLKRTELNTMSSHLRKFIVMSVFSSWKRSKHFISVKFPHFFGSFRDKLSFFIGMPVSFGIFITDTFSFSGLRNKLFGLLGMLPIPPRRILSSKIKSLAFQGACLTAILGSNLFGATSEFFFTDKAIKDHIFTSYGIRENWVNSGKHSDYQSVVSKSILSQALSENSLKVQRLGVEPFGDKAPTKTQPERDDIVRTAWRHAEASHKQTCDNKLTTPQDGLTRDQWSWAQYAVTVTIDGFLERVANSGDWKIEDILDAKKLQAQESLELLLEQHIFQGTPGSKDLRSLASIIANSGTEGGISGTTNTWWQSQIKSSGSWAAQGPSDLTNLVNTIAFQNPAGNPELLVSDQTSFEAYQNSLRAYERLTDNKMEDIGIVNLKFMNIPWTFSPQGTSGTIYALHGGAIEFIVNSDTDFILTPFVMPTNQDARTAKILLAASMTTPNRRKLGKMTGVTA